jgi:hypothetical protein
MKGQVMHRNPLYRARLALGAPLVAIAATGAVRGNGSAAYAHHTSRAAAGQ